MVLVYCTSTEHLKKSQQNPFNSFKVMSQQENLIKENNSKRKQGNIKVLVLCIASQCLLSFYEVSTKSLD